MKVLFFLARWSNGGIEKNICNYLETLNNQKIEVYIAALVKDGDLFDSVLQEYNIGIITPFGSTKAPVGNGNRAQFIVETCRRIRPDIVHINVSCGVAFMYSHALKKHFPEVKVLVHGHSTNTEPPHVFLKDIYYNFYRVLWEKTADYSVACSKKAGEYLFSKRRINSSSYRVLHSAIDTQKYKFSLEKRKAVRNKYNIPESTFVIGTVGRFDTQKNPQFIVDIIYELCKKMNDFMFMWIGEGELKEEIKAKVNSLKLADRVVFINKSNNIPGILSAMDVFILPSLYEGLSIVNIEAQASGLFNLISSTISDEARISNKFIQLPIDNYVMWADQIMHIFKECEYLERDYPEAGIRKAGFDIENNTKELIEIYRLM